MIAEMSAELTDIESARELVLARCTALSAESVPIADALNRTLAAAVVSGERVPGFDNSAMDGYAV
ncbi:MAG: molybdopterin molybdotransferase, partial [Solirubrobacterales bacterium]